MHGLLSCSMRHARPPLTEWLEQWMVPRSWSSKQTHSKQPWTFRSSSRMTSSPATSSLLTRACCVASASPRRSTRFQLPSPA